MLAKTEQYLVPAESKAIAGHITLMLQHYYRGANIPPSVAEGLALQWLECLEDFPEWAVRGAVKEYLKNDVKGRKPVPGQIVALARQQTSKYHALKFQCRRIIDAKPPEPPRAPPTEEEKAAISKILEDARRNLAMGDIAK